MKRFLQQQQGHAAGEEDKLMVSKESVPVRGNGQTPAATPTTPSPASAAPLRTCQVTGCAATLGASNRTGFCRRHFHRWERQRLAASRGKTNGHAIASNGNGSRANSNGRKNGRPAAHAPSAARPFNSNGNGSDQISEARVNSLMLAWPLEQKLKILNAYLTAAV